MRRSALPSGALLTMPYNVLLGCVVSYPVRLRTPFAFLTLASLATSLFLAYRTRSFLAVVTHLIDSSSLSQAGCS